MQPQTLQIEITPEIASILAILIVTSLGALVKWIPQLTELGTLKLRLKIDALRLQQIENSRKLEAIHTAATTEEDLP
jgi:hypothetical protein